MIGVGSLVMADAAGDIGTGLTMMAKAVDDGAFQGSTSGAAGRASNPASTEVPSVHMGQQGKHIPGHNNFQQGRSVLRADPAELAKSAGSGSPVNKVPRGQPGFRERVQFEQIIGDFVKDGVSTPTRNAIIHYGQKGIHIVPAAP